MTRREFDDGNKRRCEVKGSFVNKTQMAEMLNMSRKSVYNFIHKHQLTPHTLINREVFFVDDIYKAVQSTRYGK